MSRQNSTVEFASPPLKGKLSISTKIMVPVDHVRKRKLISQGSRSNIRPATLVSEIIITIGDIYLGGGKAGDGQCHKSNEEFMHFPQLLFLK